MNICGIVCEYNPLHNGHLYHIQTAKQNGADAIVAVMSGSFVQRGEPAILNKHTRAALALRAGADLVIELPVIWSLSPAEQFAMGAVYLLHALQMVDSIAFGCETHDLTHLQTAAEGCTYCRSSAMSEQRDALLRHGLSYPAAIEQLVRQQVGDTIADILKQPNNTLAVNYLMALRSLSSVIRPMPIQRMGAAHDSMNGSNSFASASQIRTHIATGGSIHGMIPDFTEKALRHAMENGDLAALRHLERVILYRLRTLQHSDELTAIAEVGSHGLAQRLYQHRQAASVEDFLNAVKTKRYPMARLRRILMHLLLNIQQADIQQLPPYGRILALNETGQQILRLSKPYRILPYQESLRKLADTGEFAKRCAELESMASDLHRLACQRIDSGGDDFRRKITLTPTKCQSM